MHLGTVSDLADQFLVLAIIAAPSLLGFGFGTFATVKLFKRWLRSGHVIPWSFALTVSLVWVYATYLYGTWLNTYMVRAGKSAPAVGADIFGLFRGAFLYGPLGTFLLGPSVVALVMTIRSRPQDYSLSRYAWQRFLRDQFRGPYRFYWWAFAIVLVGVLVRVSVMLAIKFGVG
jgi:hypothetical protein